MANPAAPPPLEGGCLCGRVRCRAAPDHRDGYYCHCRMCQLAFGNTRAAYLNLRRSDLQWRTEPSWYASSKIARRASPRRMINHDNALPGAMAGRRLTHARQSRP